MRFTINRENLIGPLSRVNTVVEKSPSIPLLSHVYLSSNGSEVSLIGSNIEIEIVGTITGIDAEAGEFLFPSRSVLEFCRRQPEKTTLLFEATENELAVQALGAEKKEEEDPNQSLYKTSTYSPNDFPRAESVEWEIQFSIDSNDLYNLIRRTAFSMGVKDVRFYLNAMLFEIDENSLRTVTTDGHRLSTSTQQANTGVESKLRSIVSRKAVLALMQLLPDLNSEVNVEISAKFIRVHNAEFMFTAKLLEGMFPDWSAAIPSNMTRSILIPRHQLLNRLNMVNILSDENRTNIVSAELNIEGNLLKIRGKTSHQQIDAAVEIEQEGDNLQCEMNCKYMLDVVETMSDTETIQIQFRDAESACMIKSPDSESTIYLIMLLQ